MKLKEMVKEGKISKEWLEGLKAGLKIAKEMADKQGYEIYFPEIDEMEMVKEGKTNKKGKQENEAKNV